MQHPIDVVPYLTVPFSFEITLKERMVTISAMKIAGLEVRETDDECAS